MRTKKTFDLTGHISIAEKLMYLKFIINLKIDFTKEDYEKKRDKNTLLKLPNFDTFLTAFILTELLAKKQIDDIVFDLNDFYNNI